MLSYFHTPEHLTAILADRRAALPWVRTLTGADYLSSRGLWLKMIADVRRELSALMDAGKEQP